MIVCGGIMTTGSGENISSQDKIIYNFEQKVASLQEERDKAVDQVEELRSENEKLRCSLQKVIKKEGTPFKV